jgi:hypothetical protein
VRKGGRALLLWQRRSLAASVESRQSWHAMSVFNRSARWLTADSVPRSKTDQRAGERAAHSLFMPERMQLLIVTSISCVLQPAGQNRPLHSHGATRRRRAPRYLAQAGTGLLRTSDPLAAWHLYGHRT